MRVYTNHEIPHFSKCLKNDVGQGRSYTHRKELEVFGLGISKNLKDGFPKAARLSVHSGPKYTG